MSKNRTADNALTIEEARAQVEEFAGPLRSEYLRVGDEVFEIPHPALLDDEQQDRYDALQFEIQQCDRHPDVVIPDHKLESRTITVDGEEVEVGKDGTVTGGNVRVEVSETFVPGRVIKGQPILPYQKTDEDGNTTLLTPNYNARLAIALWGEERYAKFRAAGGSSRIIGMIWQRMNRDTEEREASDPKSD